jgi:hypothetical protein
MVVMLLLKVTISTSFMLMYADNQDDEDDNRKRRPSVTEEKRLARIVQLIDQDNAVVPRGSVSLTAQRKAIVNPTFQGLSVNDAQNLKSYAHLRDPVALLKKSILQREGLSRTQDFMDTIDEDLPQGIS